MEMTVLLEGGGILEGFAAGAARVELHVARLKVGRANVPLEVAGVGKDLAAEHTFKHRPRGGRGGSWDAALRVVGPRMARQLAARLEGFATCRAADGTACQRCCVRTFSFVGCCRMGLSHMIGQRHGRLEGLVTPAAARL